MELDCPDFFCFHFARIFALFLEGQGVFSVGQQQWCIGRIAPMLTIHIASFNIEDNVSRAVHPCAHVTGEKFDPMVFDVRDDESIELSATKVCCFWPSETWR